MSNWCAVQTHARAEDTARFHLHRQGYDVFNWSDQALLRAVAWLHDEAGYPASGDDEATPWLINGVYNTSFPVQNGARPGKNGLGWYEWIYGR